jgi:prepilin-type N-terminal cleavage/methylation domain-containing protein
MNYLIRYKKTPPNLSAGFTLVELLLVISIISLLSSIVVSSLNATRSKARDARRLTDLRQIQVALQLYAVDNNGQSAPGCYDSAAVGASFWPGILSSAYIASMPIDPINTSGQYSYVYCTSVVKTGNCTWTNGTNSNYILLARLENPNSYTGSCPAGITNGLGNSNVNYLLSN